MKPSEALTRVHYASRSPNEDKSKRMVLILAFIVTEDSHYEIRYDVIGALTPCDELMKCKTS